MDGSDRLRPSKDTWPASEAQAPGALLLEAASLGMWAWLPSLREVGACHWGWAAGGRGQAGLCPAVALRGLHSGFTSIWVTERLASSGEDSTFSSAQWEHRPYRADTAALHGQSSSRTCDDTPHVLWETQAALSVVSEHACCGWMLTSLPTWLACLHGCVL